MSSSSASPSEFKKGLDQEFERRRAIALAMGGAAKIKKRQLAGVMNARSRINMGGGKNSDEVAAWPTAEVSFMTPQFAATVVHGTRPGAPDFDEHLAEMEKDNTAYEIARTYAVQNVIRPEETRDYLIKMLEIHSLKLTNGIGQHLLRAWPTSF